MLFALFLCFYFSICNSFQPLYFLFLIQQEEIKIVLMFWRVVQVHTAGGLKSEKRNFGLMKKSQWNALNRREDEEIIFMGANGSKIINSTYILLPFFLGEYN